MKNWMATSFCARCSAVWDITREPVKRQMMITLAKPSIAESRPKPTSAIEPAMIAGDDRDDPLDAHHAQRQPGQQLHARGELAVALGADRRHGPRGGGRDAIGSSTDALMRSPAVAVTAASSARPRSVSPYMTILPVARRAGQAGDAQRARVVGDELLVAADDPRQVAHARRPALGQRDGDRQPRRIAQRLGAGCPRLQPRRSGSPRRAASALGRSRQSSSQVSGSGAMPRTLVRSHGHAYVGVGARLQTRGQQQHSPHAHAGGGVDCTLV